MKPRSKDLKPGQTLRCKEWNRDHTLARRRADDTGWLVLGGGGWADGVLDSFDFEVVGMTVFIPDLTPEMCQEEADGMRRWGVEPADQTAFHLFLAALMEQHPAVAHPVEVGRLATWKGTRNEYLVLAIHESLAWCKTPSGTTTAIRLNDLTDAGPVPEGWGE